MRWWLHEWFWLGLGLVFAAADQVVKAVIMARQPVIEGFLTIRPVLNTGASFGLLQDSNTLLAWVGIIVLGAFTLYYPRLKPAVRRWGLLVMGGVVSNVIDRLARGAVVDYLDLGWWPVFNGADAMIVVGVAALIVVAWRDREAFDLLPKKD